MSIRYLRLVLLTACVGLGPVASWADESAQRSDSESVTEPQASASREQILQSERWRRLRRQFDEWLSVQEIYSDEEVAALSKNLERRVAKMSAVELQDFLYDTEDRLAVLLSDEANAARDYLGLLTPQAQRKALGQEDQSLDAFEISVSQLRRELRQFQQRVASSHTAQQRFNESREELSVAVTQQRQAQQQAIEKSRKNASRSPRPTMPPARSPYVPHHDAATPSRPTFLINPFGGVTRMLK